MELVELSGMDEILSISFSFNFFNCVSNASNAKRAAMHEQVTPQEIRGRGGKGSVLKKMNPNLQYTCWACITSPHLQLLLTCSMLCSYLIDLTKAKSEAHEGSFTKYTSQVTQLFP